MTDFKPIKPKPVFITTTNVRNFSVMMNGLDLSRGEGRLGVVYGRAGRGKTDTTQRWAALNNAIYLRMRTIWTSELPFLQELARECLVSGVTFGRKAPAFTAVMDSLLDIPRTIILDEIEKLPRRMLDVVRDLSDLAAVPIVLVGEDELPPLMKQNRRVWSRTYKVLQFKPIEVKDVVIFASEAYGLSLHPDIANLFYQACGGDWRIVKRDLINLVYILNSRQTTTIDMDVAAIAVKQGLSN